MKGKYLAVLMILLAVLVLPGEARGIANGLPDIVLTKLEVSQNSVAIGEEANVVITVFYDSGGNKKALSTNCKVELQTNGIIFPFDCNGLKSGESRTYTTNVVYATAGSYSVKAAADPGNLIQERNESNNIKEATLIVRDLPNLKIYEFHCAGGNCPAQPIENDPIGFAWALENTGAGIEGASLIVNVTMNGKVISSKTYDNMYIPSGGFYADGGLVSGLFYEPGIYTFKLNVTLDAKESDLADNSAEFIVEATPLPPGPLLPDLTIGDVAYGWDSTNPFYVTVHYAVYNIGTASSVSTNVEIRKDYDSMPYTVRTIGSIAPGGKIEDSFTIETALIGGIDPFIHYLRYNVDANNVIEESKEDNNGWTSMLCYPPGKDPWCGQLPPFQPLPDITLSYISVEQPDSGSIKLNYYLKNNGPGILDSQVIIRYETDALGTIQIVRKSLVSAILGPGEQMVASETFSNNDIPTPIFPGGYYHFWINADPENMIPETDENNNILVFGVCVTNCYSITPTPTLTPP